MSGRARAVVSFTWACALGCSAGTGASSATHPSAQGGASGSAAAISGASSTSSAGGGASGSGSGGGTGGGTATSPCSARPGLLFCDDFESATVGAVPGAPWSPAIIGDGSPATTGAITVDSSVPAHSGSKALHAAGLGFQTLLVYHDTAILPQNNGRFFIRAFIRLGAAMTAGHNTFVIADTFAAAGQNNSVRLGEANSMLIMTVTGDAHGYNSNASNTALPGVQFTPLTYTCLEMLFDTPKKEIDVWVDGKEVPDLHATNLTLDTYDTVRFGFEKYAGPVADIWYDDIAIGTQQIGCN